MGSQPSLIVAVFLVTSIIVFIFLLLRESTKNWNEDRERRLKSIEISDVDTMTGDEFETFAARLLQDRGFMTTIVKHSNNVGTGIVASKDGIRYAIHCKLQARSVGPHAVSEALAGRGFYQCHGTMLFTNREFTLGAKTLAKSMGCHLIARQQLADWIVQFRNQSMSDSNPDPVPR
jgi:restriction system protein